MKKLLPTLSALLMFGLAGCVSTAPVAIPPARLAQSAGQTVATTIRPMPPFSAMKATNAMFGAIGGLASVGSGNSLIKQANVPDPAVVLAGDLTAHLATTFRLVPQGTVPLPSDSSDIKVIATAAAGKADMVLDVQTVNWSSIYLPLNWTHYRVFYSVKLRLIDVQKQEAIAEGFFGWQTPDGAGNPTFDELFGGNANGLRLQLDTARKAATEYFRSQILVDKH